MHATNLKSAVVGGIVLILGLLLANAGVSYWTTIRLVEDDRLVAHTRQVLETLDAVRAAITEAETGQRGYLITDQSNYLRTYETARADVRLQLAKVRDLTADNPEEQARVARLGSLIADRLERLQRNVTLRREKGFEAVQPIVGTDQGQQLMDQIRQSIDEMHEAEDQLLGRRTSQSTRTQYLKIATNVVGTSLGIVALGWAYFLFQRRLEERRNAEMRARAEARRDAAISELRHRAISESSIESLGNRAARLVADVLDVPLTKILELLPGDREFLLRGGVGCHDGLVGHARISAGLDSQAGYTLHASEPVVKGDLTTHAPVIVEDLRNESRFALPSLLFDHGVVSGMSVIIYDQPDHPYGVLGAHTIRPRAFSEEESSFLQAVANVLASAIQRRRAEEGLRQSEERFRALADSIPGFVWTSQPDGRCDYVNQQWYDYTGMSFEETEGFGWTSAIKEEDVKQSTVRWMNAVETGEPFECEFRFREKQGMYRWFLGLRSAASR